VGPLTDQNQAVDSFPSVFHQYRLLDLLARGPNAKVYYATRKGAESGECLALKRVSPEVSRDERLTERWLQAGRRVTPLIHPGLCRIHEVGKADGMLFCAMELIAGIDLARLCARLQERAELMPVHCMAFVMSSVASALDAAHSRRGNGAGGVVHGNLSASNILIGYDGVVKITDLGMSAALAPTPLASLPARQSNPEPGQVTDAEVRGDVAAIGARLLELLGGREPTSLRQSALVRKPAEMLAERSAGAALRAIAMRAIDQRPEARFASAAALRQALDDFMATRGIAVSGRTLSEWLGTRFEVERREGEELATRWASPPVPDAGPDAQLRVLATLATMATTIRPIEDETNFRHLAVPSGARKSERPKQAPARAAAKEAPPPKPKVKPAAAGPAAGPPAAPVRSDPDKTPPRGHVAEKLAAEMVGPPPSSNSEPTRVGPLPLAVLEAALPRGRIARQGPAVSSRPGPLWPRSDRPLAAPQRIWLIGGAAVIAVAAVALVSRQAPEPAPPPNSAPTASAAPQPAESQRPEPKVAQVAERSELESASSATAAAARSAAAPAPAGESVAATTGAVAPDGEPDLVISAETGNSSRAVALSIASAPKRRAQPRLSTPGRETEDNAPETEAVAAPPAVNNTASSSEMAAARPSSSPSAPAPYDANAGAAVTPAPMPARPAVPVAVAPAPVVRAPSSGGQVREATPTSQEAPRFPARARRRGVRSGNVSVSFGVDRSGAVRNPVVVQSNPPGIFDEAAIEAVLKWRYQPRLEAGVPVESHDMRVRLLFSDGR
jgi:TonB family protein